MGRIFQNRGHTPKYMRSHNVLGEQQNSFASPENQFWKSNREDHLRLNIYFFDKSHEDARWWISLCGSKGACSPCDTKTAGPGIGRSTRIIWNDAFSLLKIITATLHLVRLALCSIPSSFFSLSPSLLFPRDKRIVNVNSIQSGRRHWVLDNNATTSVRVKSARRV